MTNKPFVVTDFLKEELPAFVKTLNVPEDFVIDTLVRFFSTYYPLRVSEVFTTDELVDFNTIYVDYVKDCKDKEPYTMNEFCYYLFLRGCLYD